jgi:TRAP-type transport system small permease protein
VSKKDHDRDREPLNDALEEPDLEQKSAEIWAGFGWLSKENRHLKWRAFDWLEVALATICGLLLFTFTTSVTIDVLSRNLGRSFLFLQELTLGCFVWGVFLGAAVALRRRQHFYLVAMAKRMVGIKRIVMEIIGLGSILVIFGVITFYGYRQFQSSFALSMQVSSRPLALLTGSIPTFGVLGLAFTLEELINGLRGGFETPVDTPPEQQMTGA